MNIFAGLETFLYVLSSALFYPVVAGLVLLVFWVVVSLGAFLREYIERRQGESSALRDYKQSLASKVAAGGGNRDIDLERFLQRSELELIKSLDKIRFVIRVGPALGLMGTLIPMGIALSALAQGDMPKMAGSMVTAFTSVVAGLACSVTAYVISLVKEKWARNDIREMEYATELSLRAGNGEYSPRKEEDRHEIFEETEKV